MNNLDLHDFYKHFHERKFDIETCFLCAGSLKELGATSEHVIPRWAQNRYDLWNQQLWLINGSSISYKYLIVPCCEECNKYRLQPIETLIANAVYGGPETVRALGNRILFLWLGKIFYGILYKELFLSSSQHNTNAVPITNPDILKLYDDHLIFLQEARKKIETINFCPGSIFVFRTQKPEINQMQWDFTDNIDTLFIGVRMGEVGIIGVLNDGGILQLHNEIFENIQDHPLHPLQFRELCAAIAYQSSIRQRSPTQITQHGNPHKIYQLPVGGFSNKPFYGNWDLDDYAHFLAHYTELPYKDLHPHPNKITTFIFDPDGKPIFIPFEDN